MFSCNWFCKHVCLRSPLPLSPISSQLTFCSHWNLFRSCYKLAASTQLPYLCWEFQLSKNNCKKTYLNFRIVRRGGIKRIKRISHRLTITLVLQLFHDRDPLSPEVCALHTVQVNCPFQRCVQDNCLCGLASSLLVTVSEPKYCLWQTAEV